MSKRDREIVDKLWSQFFTTDIGYHGITKEGVPRIPTLRKPYTRVLEAIKKQGNRLEMCDWHTCDTAHCLGGWVIHLCRRAGRELVHATINAFAASAILLKSRPDAKLPNFYTTDAAAMRFIKRRAAEEV